LTIDTISPEQFERQVAYLAANCRVMALDELVESVRTQRPIPPDAVAITFDDGYRDNYEFAFPILRKYDVPATIYLVGRYIGTGDRLWFDQVLDAFQRTSRSVLRYEPLDMSLPLATVEERGKAAFQVLGCLKRDSETERPASIRSLLASLGVKTPGNDDPLMLDWSQVSEMARGGISFGSHTMTHPILTQMPIQRAWDEIVHSKSYLEERIQRPIRTFAYPNGTRDDYSPETVAAVRQAGYESAVTTLFRDNDLDALDPFQLGRIALWERDVAAFALKLNYYRRMRS
jgi:peptidoglycan/xylan/chitin deacetylase (PgdA/CDA1 family)